ncbi:MAG: hypothetical protein FJ303_13725 [Planctomycetes bacterium]|nr:hypothetical protein [Planctomycetota bacterium]
MSMRIECPNGHVIVVDAAGAGGDFVCPLCAGSAPFDIEAARHARKDEGKRRSSSRADDEDDEDDRPQKKSSKKSARPSDDDEDRPRKKSRDDEDDDDDRRSRKKSRRRDEDETPEAQDSDDGIEWTPRKRQLQVASYALIVMIVGLSIFLAFNFFNWKWMAFYEMELFGDAKTWAPALFYWLSVPLLYLGIIAFVVAMVMSLWAPSQVEGMASIITCLVFTGIILFVGLLLILNYFELLLGDLARGARFVQIMAIASAACMVVGMMAAMAYLSQLMVFMKLTLESSQAVTNMMFVILLWGVMFALVYISPKAKDMVGDWFGYLLVGAAAAVTGLAEYILVNLILLIIQVRKTIDKYIKDE